MSKMNLYEIKQKIECAEEEIKYYKDAVVRLRSMQDYIDKETEWSLAFKWVQRGLGGITPDSSANWNRVYSDENVKKEICQLILKAHQDEVEECRQKVEEILGESFCLGEYPDWE